MPVTLTIDVERETDGRWLAEVPSRDVRPGCPLPDGSFAVARPRVVERIIVVPGSALDPWTQT